MKKKTILCHECKKPILHKQELAVVGNAFLTYHNVCFEKIKHKNIYAFYSGYKTNGIFVWNMLIILNLGIWSTYYFFNAPLKDTVIFSLFISVGILFYRVTSFVLYERHYI